MMNEEDNKVEEREFRLKSRAEAFKFKKMSPVTLLSLQMQIDLNDMEKNEKTFSTILENTQVKIGGTWVPVKEKNMEVYYPVGIEDSMNALQEIIFKFFEEVLKPVFQKSAESSQKTQ